MSKFVEIDVDNFDAALEWAKENCPSYVTNDSVSEFEAINSEASRISTFRWVVKIQFYFGDDADALMFQLRWS